MVKKISPFLLLLLCAVISCGHEEPSNRIDPSELLKNGYKYILFGSQKTNGIEFYDLGNQTFLSFLKGEGGLRFFNPVVDKMGRAYCLRELDDILARDKKTCLISFDLQKQSEKGDEAYCLGQGFSDGIVLSPDNQRLAFTYYDSNSKAYLGIFNVKSQTMEKNIVINKDLLEQYIKIVWKPDNNSVVLWERDEIRPAYEVNILTGKTERLILFYYPLEYFQNKFVLLKKRENYGVYLKDLEKNKLVRLKEAWHTIKFSRDGKYLVAGRLRGKGFETLAVIDANNPERSLQIKMDDHPSTALGIDLW